MKNFIRELWNKYYDDLELTIGRTINKNIDENIIEEQIKVLKSSDFYDDIRQEDSDIISCRYELII